MKNDNLLRLGTSSWSHESWRGSVYSHDARPGEFLGQYARRYTTVEVDTTWYRIPGEGLVRKWAGDTPEGFVFAAKVPGEITHEKMLVGCEAEFKRFVQVMSLLGEKLGPLLLQFPYAFKPDRFDVLAGFLKTLPKEIRFAVEIRHKGWLTERFYDLLREHRVAFALVDLVWMPRQEVLTTDWTYLRFVGDRKGIEKQTKTWDKVIVDRTKDLQDWLPKIESFLERSIPVWAYFNNHYAGHAPGSIELLKSLMGVA